MIDQTFAALADPVRRGVIELLRKQPRRAGELADACDTSASVMSRHLRLLRKTGLVQEDGLEEDARVRVYRLRPEPFKELRGWLEEVETFWAMQLDAFKAHAERAKKKKPAGRGS